MPTRRDRGDEGEPEGLSRDELLRAGGETKGDDRRGAGVLGGQGRRSEGEDCDGRGEPAEEAGLDTVHALVAACAQEKLQIVQLVGFAEQYRFARSFGLPGEAPCDVLLLRAEG